MGKSHTLLLGAIVLLAGCTGGVPGSDTSPGKTGASQNSTDAFSISNETLVVTRGFDGKSPSDVDCYSVGMNAMWAHLKQRIDDEFEGITVGIRSAEGMTTGEDSMMIVVSRQKTRGRSWVTTNTGGTPTIVSRPSISYQRLNSVAPSEARITITYENDTVTCHAPVTVQNVTMQLD